MSVRGQDTHFHGHPVLDGLRTSSGGVCYGVGTSARLWFVDEFSAVAWPNGCDLAPDALYDKLSHQAA